MSPTLVGRVSAPEKMAFIKKYKILDNIAAYLIESLKSKWKNKQKIWIAGYGNYFFIYVLEGNLQRNSWICKMIDYIWKVPLLGLNSTLTKL